MTLKHLLASPILVFLTFYTFLNEIAPNTTESA